MFKSEAVTRNTRSTKPAELISAIVLAEQSDTPHYQQYLTEYYNQTVLTNSFTSAEIANCFTHTKYITYKYISKYIVYKEFKFTLHVSTEIYISSNYWLS